MGLRCTIYFVLLAVSILAVNPGFGATQLDELFRYAGKMPAFQKIINDTASCQTWLTNQSSALWAFTQDAVAFRLQKIWNKGQSLNIRGLVWRENGVTKVFNPQGGDLSSALAKLGLNPSQVQVFSSLNAAAKSVEQTLPVLRNPQAIVAYLSSFPETRRAYAAILLNDEIKVLNNNGDVLKGVSVAYDAWGLGVSYRVQDPNRPQTSTVLSPTANLIFLAGMGADSSNAVSVLPTGQSLAVPSNSFYKKVQREYIGRGQNMPRLNIFTTDLPFSGNGQWPQGPQAQLDATLLELGRYLLYVKVQTGSSSPNVLVLRSASAWAIELIRRQAEIVEVLRAEVKRNNLIPNIDNILPADGKLVEHLVMVGGTNLGPTLGYDASLQQSIDDALDTAGTGYRPNWPSFCWCHDLYTAIGQIKAQNFASWEEYYSAALQDITVDFYVGEFDKQTVAESRNFYKNLSDKNENMNYYLIEGSDHDVFSNTASNRDRYSPVPAMYKLMSRTQQLVNVVGDNIGQLKFAARVGSGVVLPQENTQP